MDSPLDATDGNRIVEFSTRDEAQHAISTLSNTSFMGRQIFVREVPSLARSIQLMYRTESRNPDITVVDIAGDTVDMPEAATWVEEDSTAIPLVVRFTLETFSSFSK